MKVRATTSFSVEPQVDSITYDSVRSAVEKALARLTGERDLIEDTSISRGRGYGGHVVVDLAIVFRSDSYGAVDEAMLQLAEDIASALEAGPASPRVDSHATGSSPPNRIPPLAALPNRSGVACAPSPTSGAARAAG